MDRAVASARELVGEHLGHYCILERIGGGSMGEVYRAHDDHLNREVAVKVLPEGTWADEESRRSFRREALTLSRVNHPNIATIHDFDCCEATDFLVTEYVSGISLQACVEKGPLPEEEVLRLGCQLVDGVAAAHDQGVVHRDLKPGNLRLTADGRLKVLDFGLARPLPKAQQASSTESASDSVGLSGTLAYMAPEQLRGEAPDARSDIYSIGVIFYEMSTGRRPFEAPLTTTLIDKIFHMAPLAPGRLRAELSASLEQIILKCLEKEPAYRYQSSRELLTDLRRASQASTREKSVAVLYFENLSGQKEDEYFRDRHPSWIAAQCTLRIGGERSTRWR
jgi:non-specific serine/threonine protein kinase